ncbi:hypothetical protein, partial [Achromobacter xylosoxidans]|uniref:hypothetical protein n=1 Tax=Alcaligenes xylosoxydans xylosoxydans TaxID=85698 RepID=UPI001E60939C
ERVAAEVSAAVRRQEKGAREGALFHWRAAVGAGLPRWGWNRATGPCCPRRIFPLGNFLMNNAISVEKITEREFFLCNPRA